MILSVGHCVFGPGSGGWTKGRDPLPGQLFHLGNDLAEANNLYEEEPDVVTELTELMARIVREGRSTSGSAAKNDVKVKWQRFLGSD